MNILQACDNPELFEPWFRGKRDSFGAWFVFLAALFGLAMTDEQFAVYQNHTGRQERPTRAVNEAWLVIGRRGGKSFVSALVAVFLACFFDYRPYLAPGERGTIMVIAADKKQARVILRYIAAMLNGIEMLKDMKARETATGFDLDNDVTIEIGTASFRSSRGYTYVAVLADEIAFWRTEDSAEPDFEILSAIRPGMATIPNAMLLCMSSPYARKGALWDAFRRFYGKDGAPLVWKATTREMNPSIPQSYVDSALERDHASAMAEYMAEFRSDIEAFVSREVVETCVTPGVFERPFVRGVKYRAFVDPSGGSNDSFTLAIAHREGDQIVHDLTRERKPPFSPEATVAEFCRTLKDYGITEVTGDRYGGEWPREQFRKHGIGYRLSDKPRTDLYLELLPTLNSQKVDLLDHPVMVNQIVGLERRVSRGGKESIDHAPGGHDDIANSLAGAIWLCAEVKKAPTAVFGTYSTPRPGHSTNFHSTTRR
ncbi:hypothetical protein [Sinorhizobium fredii]|uniref:hypothetical protein n=1 Tax=Rhizobium fredii TaxID=380 RepID=UPI0004BCEBBA|nr:hypothetical protein [Sinorhizobium fredii]ASY69735.1 hypothetical protein SF83666_c23190 [Sinorhizobium fredii CCBAU 83666]